MKARKQIRFYTWTYTGLLDDHASKLDDLAKFPCKTAITPGSIYQLWKDGVKFLIVHGVKGAG